MRALQPERRTSAHQRDLVYYALGQGPVLLFANGLGASWRGFRNQLAHLADRYRCLFWDYRGVFANRERASASAAPNGLADHAADALAILDSEGVERAAVLGWSFGVHVALQLFADAPDRVAALALVSGAPGAWGPAGNGHVRGLQKLYPTALSLLSRVPGLLELLARTGGRSPEAVTWARRVGLVGTGADPELIAEVARDLSRVDVAAALRSLRGLGEHDLSEMLATVDVPTLVIGGNRDPFTSRAALERMVQAIAGAEYLLLPGGTHYLLLDHAEHVNLRIDKFFAERGFGA